MSKSNVPAAVAAVLLAFSFSPVVVSAGEPARATVSTAAAPALKASKDAADAKNYALSISKAREALALGNKTPYDAYVANQLLAYAYGQQKNSAEALKALQGQIDSGFPQPAEQTRIVNYMTRISYEQKNYAQAAEYGNRLIGMGAADQDTYGLVGHSLYQQGKHAEAAKFLGDFVESQERRNQVPREQTLNVLRAAQDKQGNKAGVSDTLEKLVVHYPKADYWDLLLYSVRRDPKLTERQTLQVYRLMVATDTLKRCGDYTEMADLAVNAGIPGEAQRVLEAGVAAKVCTEKVDADRLQRLLASAGRAASEDRAQLAKLEADARASATGELDVVAGSSLFGYGEFPKSVEMLSRGLSKGGVKNVADSQLMLGVSQLRANNKAEALKTFRGIKSEDPLTQRIAKLWTLYAS